MTSAAVLTTLTHQGKIDDLPLPLIRININLVSYWTEICSRQLLSASKFSKVSSISGKTSGYQISDLHYTALQRQQMKVY